MNQLQVLKKLIPIYKKAINRIADGELVTKVLQETGTGFGICTCYLLQYKNQLISKLVDDICGSNTHWYPMPIEYEKTNDVIECLSYRLTIMQLMVMDIKQTT